MRFFRCFGLVAGWLFLFHFIIPGMGYAQSGQSYEVTSSVLNVRSGPGIDAEVIGSLQPGDTVMAFDEKYDWVQTYYEGEEAWVAEYQLTAIENGSNSHDAPMESAQKTEERARVPKVSVDVSDGVNVRSGPSMGDSIIADVTTNDTYTIMETEDHWQQIRLNEKTTGWVPKQVMIGFEDYSETMEKVGASEETNHFSEPARSNDSLEGYTIVLDAGHGGKDPGAIGVDDLNEKTLALETAHRAANQLQEEGAEVILTRREDTFIPLDDRSQVSNVNDADVFISLHYNAFPDPFSQGVTTYYLDEDAKLLAAYIQSSLSDTVSLSNRGIRQEDFAVLEETDAPAVLMELGFITNPHDARIVQTDAFQEKAVQAITNGVTDYLRQ